MDNSVAHGLPSGSSNTSCPALAFDCDIVYFRPVGVSRVRRFRPEAIVVGHPQWPTEPLTRLFSGTGEALSGYLERMTAAYMEKDWSHVSKSGMSRFAGTTKRLPTFSSVVFISELEYDRADSMSLRAIATTGSGVQNLSTFA